MTSHLVDFRPLVTSSKFVLNFWIITNKMDRLRSFCICLLAFISQVAAEKKVNKDFQPMVAFLCNKPTMYLTKEGWQRDEKTDCLDSAKDILQYCQKRYPDLGITNIVEAQHSVLIENWCSFGHKHCKHHGSHTVIPYRCLAGPFQSDALLVPEHCIFDHIHNSKKCMVSQDWEKESKAACAKRKMSMQTYGILLPCDIDKFSGVEYVCCPDKIEQVERPKIKIEVKDEKHETIGKEEVEEKVKETKKPKESTPDFVEPLPHYEQTEPAKQTKMPSDIYLEYLHSAKLGEFVNEHQRFKAAEKKWESHHHEKITKIMKDWADARQRVQELKAQDPHSAEKLNKEITHRFQKTYEALEQEGMAERKQLTALHQQRVQADLNNKKRHAMEKYMTVLQRDITDGAEVWKALRGYIKAEEKDRMHSINHYKHLLDTDPQEAEHIRQQTLDHVNFINQRVDQSLDMLRKVPKLEKKIRKQAEELMSSYADIDASITNLLVKAVKLSKQEEKEEKEEEMIKIEAEKEPEKEEKEEEIKIEAHEEIKEVVHKDEEEKKTEEPIHIEVHVEKDKPKETEKEEAEEKEKEELPVEKLHPLDINKLDEPSIEIKANKEQEFDDETMENEHDYLEVDKPIEVAHIAHAHDSGLEAEQQSYVQRQHIDESTFSSAGPTLAIAIGSITVFVVIVVAVVVLRKRITRAPRHRGFVEVEQSASPEERHVANMQINGYENPTYKYFEMNSTANA